MFKFKIKKRIVTQSVAIVLAASMLLSGCGSEEDLPAGALPVESAGSAEPAEETTESAGSVEETTGSTESAGSGETTTAEKETQKQTARKATQKTTQKSTQTATQKTAQKATQKSTQKSTQTATQKTAQKATQKAAQKATQKQTAAKKPATYATKEQIYAPIAKWYAGYEVYGVPVYRVKSVSDWNKFYREAFQQCLTLAEPKIKACKTWHEKMKAYPNVIVSSLAFYDKLNQYRKKEREGLSVEEYSKKYDVWINDIPGDVTFNADLEQYAAARAWEDTLAGSEFWDSTAEPFPGWHVRVHTRPQGLEMYAAENIASLADIMDGADIWKYSTAHYETMVQCATGEGEGYACLTTAITYSDDNFDAGDTEIMCLAMPSTVKEWKRDQLFCTLDW